MGGPPPPARVHSRRRDGGPADEVLPGARGGAVPVDGGGPDPGPRRRHDRRDRAPHRGAARVHRGHAQAARPYRLARVGRDRERPAVRPAETARRCTDEPVGARAGGRDRGRRRRDRACRDARTAAARGRGVPAVPIGPRRHRLGLLASSPETTAEAEALSAPALLLAAFDARASRPPARALWPELDVADLLVDAASVRRRAARAAVRRRAATAAVHRRGHRDGARDRAPGGDRDQARRADRGPDQREHRQGHVRGPGRRGDRVRREQGRRGPV